MNRFVILPVIANESVEWSFRNLKPYCSRQTDYWLTIIDLQLPIPLSLHDNSILLFQNDCFSSFRCIPFGHFFSLAFNGIVIFSRSRQQQGSPVYAHTYLCTRELMKSRMLVRAVALTHCVVFHRGAALAPFYRNKTEMVIPPSCANGTEFCEHSVAPARKLVNEIKTNGTLVHRRDAVTGCSGEGGRGVRCFHFAEITPDVVQIAPRERGWLAVRTRRGIANRAASIFRGADGARISYPCEGGGALKLWRRRARVAHSATSCNLSSCAVYKIYRWYSRLWKTDLLRVGAASKMKYYHAQPQPSRFSLFVKKSVFLVRAIR